MLSRIAESLFWIGRYLERAEDTARLLDVQIHQHLEDPTLDEWAVSTTLLSVMGVSTPEGQEVELGRVTALLALSPDQPSSIASSLRGARENARGIRESLSSEFWECLNATIVALDARIATVELIGPHEFFGFSLFVRERVAIAAGIADATMYRDDGWQFLVLGRTIERADMTARLLSARLNDPRGEPDWPTTLRACSAYEAYLRTYRGAMSAANALEFLILDRYFPRSIYYARATAENCLGLLEPEVGRAGLGDEPRRIIGRVSADGARLPARGGDSPRGPDTPRGGRRRVRGGQSRDRDELLPARRDPRLAQRERPGPAPRGGAMSWRIATRHSSTYRYGAPVVASYNEARISPQESAGQHVLEAAVTIHPQTALYRYRDYFDSAVVAFDIPEPHDQLVVIGTSTVRRRLPLAPWHPGEDFELGRPRRHGGGGALRRVPEVDALHDR